MAEQRVHGEDAQLYVGAVLGVGVAELPHEFLFSCDRLAAGRHLVVLEAKAKAQAVAFQLWVVIFDPAKRGLHFLSTHVFCVPQHDKTLFLLGVQMWVLFVIVYLRLVVLLSKSDEFLLLLYDTNFVIVVFPSKFEEFFLLLYDARPGFFQ